MEEPSTPARPRLVALQSLAPPNGTTRFVDQVVDGAAPEVRILFFSWRAALTARYDVFHVHWPEFLVRDRRRLRALLRRVALRALLLRLRLRRVPIVRTAHNLAPHEAGTAAERRALARVDRRTDVFIRLNPTTELPPGARGTTILHGHYRDRFAGTPLPEPVNGRILYFGLIRPYKGVETLLAAFRSLPDRDLELRVVGRPSGGLREVVEREEALDDRIGSVLRFVSDEELVREVGGASLVVLPYREMHNSGALLVALSLDRPVLVPRSPSNEALAAEVGPGWVRMYDGDLDADVLRDAAAAVRAEPRSGRPRLEGRDWTTLGEQAYRTYLEAVRRSGRRVTVSGSSL